MRAYAQAVAIALLLIASSATASDYAWPLREPLAYDGDTIYVTIAGLPPELAEVSVRVLGIDAPELRGSDCTAEHVMALAARDRMIAILRHAGSVIFHPSGWDKYGGRILATVTVDGRDLSGILLAEGMARPYDGGKRQSWCP